VRTFRPFTKICLLTPISILETKAGASSGTSTTTEKSPNAKCTRMKSSKLSASGEVYDNNLKRMQFRRQKRWWNAYMLFYTRVDHNQTVYKPCIEQLSLAESKNCILPMPAPIEKSVRFQNIRFLHARSLFSAEFFAFIRNLVSCCVPTGRIEKMVSGVSERQREDSTDTSCSRLHRRKNFRCFPSSSHHSSSSSSASGPRKLFAELRLTGE
jgi:hypothetical protein